LKRLLVLFLLATSMMCGVVLAATTDEIKREVIDQLVSDGVITTEQAITAKERYAAPPRTSDQSSTAVPVKVADATSDETWQRYLSWVNLLKVIGVIFLLVAFHGLVAKVILGLWRWFAIVPIEVYQLSSLSLVAIGLTTPELVYPGQAFYVALFSAFALPMLLGWIIATHRRLEEAITRWYNTGIPVGSVLGAHACAYFAILALVYESQIFGFFAVVGFSSVLTFGMTYRWGVLSLDFHTPALPAVVLGHAIVIGTYILASLGGDLPPQAIYFVPGIEYYATIALGTALLVGSSPWFGRSNGLVTAVYSMLMIVIAFAATFLLQVAGFPVIGSILLVFCVLWLLEWLGYLSFSINRILGCAVVGGALFVGAIYFESTMGQLVFRTV
jgi:hypothetical protein